MPSVRSFTVLPALPDALKDLDFISRNMFWAWNSEFVAIFKRIDKNLWDKCGHNPVKLLGSVSQEDLESLTENQGFLCQLERVADKLRSYQKSPTWFESKFPKGTKPTIAYFSAEFGIHESIPIYSGGLGVLAGDHLKSASDLGIPLVGIGLLYQKGFFRQYLNIDGWQQEVYNNSDFYNMPVEPVVDAQGQPVIISIEYPTGKVFAKLWQVIVGRIKLYLMDSNIDLNSPHDRQITENLYGGDREMRIRQEIMLGIGGLRALSAMKIFPSVCHMNEGHAAFMALERIRQLRETKDMSFDEAMEATKAGNIFTVHTPVAAGNDEFPMEMVEKYFENYYPSLGIDKKHFLGLGKFNPENDKELFKMPVLALKLSSCRNGVSELHGKVSRNMWSGLWPKVPLNEIPIGSVTNGIHTKSWLSEEMNSLYERYLGVEWNNDIRKASTWEQIDQIPDEEFWRTHQRCKESLIAFCRSRLKTQMQRRGTYHSELNWAEEVLDPEALTIGFARRFATYKRGNLLLKDPNRLIKLLNTPYQPLQIVFAGKAHPKDTEGKEIIRQIIHFASKYDVRRRIVFLEDYDIDVARHLVKGVDIWLNTPRPPMEASGTSGMKAAANGALNMSTGDGWWCEGYTSDGGWIIGAGENYDDSEYQDTVESQAIYNMLENEIIPLFYTRSNDNLPRAWIHRMKKTIKWVTPRFNTDRMVCDYTRKFYIPASQKWNYLAAEAMSRAKALSMWKSNIKSAWNNFSIEDVQVQIASENGDGPLDLRHTQLKVGSELIIKALINLPDAVPEDVSVELYYGSVDSWGNISDGSAVKMTHQGRNGQPQLHWFEGTVTCGASGRQGLAVRILPNHEDLVNPHELGLILWETSPVN